MGLALVVGLLFLFLNARTAFWVAAGIPVALIAAIALMWARADDQHDIAFRADHQRWASWWMTPSSWRTRRLPRPDPRRRPRHRRRNRRTSHGGPRLFRHDHHRSGLRRAHRDRGPLRQPDRGYSFHRHRRADRVAGRMLPDPAQPHGPRADPFRKDALVRHALSRGEPRLRLGQGNRLSPGHCALSSPRVTRCWPPSS